MRHYNHWPVAVMCEALEVSRSGYYDYMKTQMTDASNDDLELPTRVKAIHAETGQCYGSRRMAKALQDEGYEVGPAGAFEQKRTVMNWAPSSRRSD